MDVCKARQEQSGDSRKQKMSGNPYITGVKNTV